MANKNHHHKGHVSSNRKICDLREAKYARYSRISPKRDISDRRFDSRGNRIVAKSSNNFNSKRSNENRKFQNRNTGFGIWKKASDLRDIIGYDRRQVPGKFGYQNASVFCIKYIILFKKRGIDRKLWLVRKEA